LKRTGLSKPKIKLRKCEVCGEDYVKQRMGQRCHVQCAYKLVIQDRKKQQSKDARKAKAEFNKRQRSWWLSAKNKGSTAYWLHKYVRERDRLNRIICISCDGAKPDNQFHAGHYRSVGAAPELRLEPSNIFRQCSQCNTKKSGNQAEFRIRLVKLIGLEAVEEIEGPHLPKKWTLEELEELRDHWKAEYQKLT
jgi:hypothetical protein